MVVVNPPRAGLPASVVEALRESPPGVVRAIVYVSCNIETMVRDMVRLCEGGEGCFEPVDATVVDLFPFTKYFETVVKLQRRI